MNTSKLFILLLFLSTSAFSQVTFEKGYFINLNNDTTNCEIKNLDWRVNPQVIHFIDNGKTQTINTSDISEFVIFDRLKYIRVKTYVDYSPQDFNALSKERNPNFIEESILLKELLPNYLYEFSSKGIVYYYYKNRGKIEPLVYKEYTPKPLHVKKNTLFQSQILNIFSEKGIKEKDITKLKYSKNDLIEIFNQFTLSEEVKVKAKKEKNTEGKRNFNLNIRPGASFISYDFNRITPINSPSDNLDFGNTTTYRIGLEAEIAFNFSHQKFRLLAEPTFSSFNTSIEKDNSTFNLQRSSISIPIGIRYYSYINKNNHIFYNLGGILDFPIDSILDRNLENTPVFEMEYTTGYFVGIGYEYIAKIGFELRYSNLNSLFPSEQNFEDNYQYFDFIISYNLFN